VSISRTASDRTVVLPSGREVTVTYVERAPDAEVDVHVCGACGSELVQPVDWNPAGRRHWAIELRCPECGWAGTGVFDQAAVDRFDAVLDDGTDALVAELATLTVENMSEYVERFATALEADRVLPEDF
jgi:predicted RNA-binding Zn-ribbon protein involved in translation (DUF1610 family)